MRKILYIILIIVLIYYFSNNERVTLLDKEEERGVFISYIDYSILKNKNSLEEKEIIDKMIDNIDNYGLNSIILQVRAFSDSIYYSKYFKPSLYIVNSEDEELSFDILNYFIDKCHEKNIKLYAWINPYRIRSNNNTSSISKDSSIYKMLNTRNVQISDLGIYLNPSSYEALDLILKGVEEIVLNYDIDGILYDDYFYPNDDIDNLEYKEYKNNGGSLSLKEYRINNINNLIIETYNIIKKNNKNILFGISPSGNINNNLNEEYLDIEYLINNNYIDFVIPQLYYGFNNTNMPFIDTLNTWNNLIDEDLSLYVALALYKAGNSDKYASLGEKEWIDNSDIIKKQVIVSRTKDNYKGFFIFRYSYLFNDIDNNNLKEEVNNLKLILN